MKSRAILLGDLIFASSCSSGSPESESADGSDLESIKPEVQTIDTEAFDNVSPKEFSQTDDILPITQDGKGFEETVIEPSVCRDPSDCVSLGDISISHGSAIASIQYNPNLEDSIALFGKRLGRIVDSDRHQSSFR